MRRPCTEPPFHCVTCEVEIAGTPTFHVGLPFCCAGCVADGPCSCSYDEVETPTVERRIDRLQVGFRLDLGEDRSLEDLVLIDEPVLVTGGAHR